MNNAAKVQRSTVNGVEQTAIYYDPANETETEVPSYVVIAGSVNDAAELLGMRILSRREHPNTPVVAEFHERGKPGSGLYWAVQS